MYNNPYGYINYNNQMGARLNSIQNQLNNQQQMYPNYQQPQMQQMNNVHNMQNQIPTNAYEYVNGVEGAKAYNMQPNSNMLLMDSDNPIFYMKSSDAMGKSTIKHYKFEEFDPNNLEKEVTTASASLLALNENSLTDLLADFQEVKGNVEQIMKMLEKPKPKKTEVKSNG